MTCTGTKNKTTSPPSSDAPSEGTVVSLNVLPSEHPKLKKSRTSKWRAGVLIFIYLVIIAHIVQWWITGMTLSPVEPSESMYTLELGKVNAGFILFALAILSTFLFGRFFCGWGCHIVALQDWCGWIMGKFGIHPKPFRSRLLMLGPLLLALYMFVVPTFRREVLMPLFIKMKWNWIPELGDVVPRQGFSNALMVQDYWRTFPPWYIVIPFLIVCGFAIVYFLGNKAFCSYACPYGGLFGVADRFAIGKIKVNDNCEQCGHCTAVCTSNVRVHEEVRDYGQVVDPGCMKCLDCVSVCPNGALSFGYGAPNIFAKPRTPEAEVRRAAPRKNYDLSWPQEIVFFSMGLVMFFGFRSMANEIPLLMAGGLAAIGVYFVFKAWEIIRLPSVRVTHLQARFKGSIKPAGLMTLLVALAFLVTSGWGAFVRYNLWRAEMLDTRVFAEYGTVFSPTYKPDPIMQARAAQAVRHYTLAGPRSEGGFGWERIPNDYKRMAWLAAVAGDLDGADKWLRIAGKLSNPTADTYTGVTDIMQIKGRPLTEQLEFLRQAIKQQPQMTDLRLKYFDTLLRDGQLTTALVEADALAAERKDDAESQHLAGLVYRQLNRPPQMLACFTRAVELNPKIAGFHFDLAMALGGAGDVAKAEVHLIAAHNIEPGNPALAETIAAFYKDMGLPDKSRQFEDLAREIRADQAQKSGSPPAPTPTPAPK